MDKRRVVLAVAIEVPRDASDTQVVEQFNRMLAYAQDQLNYTTSPDPDVKARAKLIEKMTIRKARVVKE